MSSPPRPTGTPPALASGRTYLQARTSAGGRRLSRQRLRERSRLPARRSLAWAFRQEGRDIAGPRARARLTGTAAPWPTRRTRLACGGRSAPRTRPAGGQTPPGRRPCRGAAAWPARGRPARVRAWRREAVSQGSLGHDWGRWAGAQASGGRRRRHERRRASTRLLDLRRVCLGLHAQRLIVLRAIQVLQLRSGGGREVGGAGGAGRRDGATPGPGSLRTRATRAIAPVPRDRRGRRLAFWSGGRCASSRS